MLEALADVSLGQLGLSAAAGLLLLIVLDGFCLPARWRLHHIPGPRPWWLLGNTLEIAAQQYFLFRAWEVWGRRYGKVFKWFWGPQPVVTVRDAEVARAIMVKHFKVFPDRSMFYPPQNPTVSAVLASGITFAKGTYWNGLRGALQPMFHSTGLASYQPHIVDAVEELCQELRPAAAAGESVDMHAALGNVALKAVGEAAFGVKFDMQEQIVGGHIHEHPVVHAANVALESTAKTLTWMLTPPLLRPLVWSVVSRVPTPQLDRLNVARMQLYTAALTLARNAMHRLGMAWRDELQMARAFDRAETKPLAQMYSSVVPAEGSVVDLLVRARDRAAGRPLKMHQIVAQINSVVVAGHDTTSFCLTSTLYYVSQHPAVKQRLFAEIDRFGRDRQVTAADMEQFPYLEAVLRESLRLSPPGWMTSREALDDITLPSGLFLPKGSVVYIDIWGIQRDPDVWAEPEAFQPERFMDTSPAALERNQLAWLAFGAGPRTCIGYKFALNELKTVLVMLWQRYDFAVDASRTSVPPLLRPGITMGYRDGLHCTVTPRA